MSSDPSASKSTKWRISSGINFARPWREQVNLCPRFPPSYCSSSLPDPSSILLYSSWLFSALLALTHHGHSVQQGHERSPDVKRHLYGDETIEDANDRCAVVDVGHLEARQVAGSSSRAHELRVEGQAGEKGEDGIEPFLMDLRDDQEGPGVAGASQGCSAWETSAHRGECRRREHRSRALRQTIALAISERWLREVTSDMREISWMSGGTYDVFGCLAQVLIILQVSQTCTH